MNTSATRSSGSAHAEKWLAYSGMAGAFLAVGPEADAQIVYTDVVPDSVLVNATFDIDFDGDGIMDINIDHVQQSSTLVAAVNLPLGAAVLGVDSGAFMYPNVLAIGAPIAPSDPAWQTQAFGSLVYASGSSVFGQWNGQSGFLGVRFQAAGGSVHYGWVQLQVATGATQATVLGYAYQAIADSTINAGDVGSLAPVPEHGAPGASINVYPDPAGDHATLAIGAGANGTYEVRIIDGIGRTMITSHWDVGATQELQLDLSALRAGTYFVQLRQGDRVVYRKITKGG